MAIDELPPPTTAVSPPGTAAGIGPMPVESNADDLEPMRLVTGSLIRWSWAIVLLAVVAAAGTAFLTRDDGVDGAQATTRLGLTQATVWPFYDVEIEAGLALANTDDFRTELEAQVGAELESVEATLTDELAVFDISVVAADRETAVAAARAAADLVLQRSLDANTLYQQQQIDAARAEIDALQVRLDTTKAQFEETAAAMLEVQELRQSDPDPALEQQEFQLYSQRESTAQIVRDLERELSTKISERDSLAAETPQSLLRIVRAASADEVDESSSNAIAIAAGLGALLVAAVVAVVFDRRRGRVRSAWQLVHVCGAADAHELEVTDQGRIVGLGAVADRLFDLSVERARLVGVVDLSDRLHLDRLTAQLRAQGIDAGRLVDGARLELVDVTHEHQGPDVPKPVTRACDAVIVATGPATAVTRATAIVQRVRRTPGLAACLHVRG